MSEFNDFDDSLKISDSEEIEKILKEVYLKYFPNMVGMIKNESKKSNSQEKGVDRIIYLDNLKTITIDEKIRKDDYADFLLEYVSNDYTGAVGWIEKDLSIDYILYVILSTKKAFLLDWRILKITWDFNKVEWKKKYGTITAGNAYFNGYNYNNGYNYTTISIAIPRKDLFIAMDLQKIKQFK